MKQNKQQNQCSSDFNRPISVNSQPGGQINKINCFAFERFVSLRGENNHCLSSRLGITEMGLLFAIFFSINTCIPEDRNYRLLVIFVNQ